MSDGGAFAQAKWANRVFLHVDFARALHCSSLRHKNSLVEFTVLFSSAQWRPQEAISSHHLLNTLQYLSLQQHQQQQSKHDLSKTENNHTSRLLGHQVLDVRNFFHFWSGRTARHRICHSILARVRNDTEPALRSIRPMGSMFRQATRSSLSLRPSYIGLQVDLRRGLRLFEGFS